MLHYMEPLPAEPISGLYHFMITVIFKNFDRKNKNIFKTITGVWPLKGFVFETLELQQSLKVSEIMVVNI